MTTPGFGSLQFGHGYYGSSPWSRLVFWEQLPELYRSQDEAQSGVMESFMEGVRPSFDACRELIRLWPDLRDPLRARTAYNGARVLRLGKEIVAEGDLLAHGLDGVVNGISEFTAMSGRFRAADVGRLITVSGSGFEENNRSVEITQILDGRTVVTDPLLRTDAGPLRWELRPPVALPADRITVAVQSGYVDGIAPGWVIHDGWNAYEVLARRKWPVARAARQLYTEQEGSDGTLLAGGVFESPAALLHISDIGKKLMISGGHIPSGGGIYEIVSVAGAVPPQQIGLDDTTLAADSGPLFWALLPQPQLDVRTRADFRGIARLGDVDLSVAPPAAATSARAAFVQADVGLWMSIRGSVNGYDGLYRILTVSSPNEVVLDAALAGPAETGLVWDIRQRTGLGDGVQVEAQPPPMLCHLAEDFGISVDSAELQSSQRAWVKNVATWVDLKGHSTGYAYAGRLGGLLVSVAKLYRVSADIYAIIEALGFPGDLYEVAGGGAGGAGTDGRLEAGTGGVEFEAASASFRLSDAGRIVSVRNSNNPANDGFYTIASVLSATRVRMRAIDTAATPEYGVGGTVFLPTLRWANAALYTTRSPLLPRYDEIDHDLLHRIIIWKAAGTRFDADMFCWDPDFDTEVPVVFVSAAAVATGLWDLVVGAPPGSPGSADAIVAVGQWLFVDASGTEHWVETVPVPHGPDWTFQVRAWVSPSLAGPVTPHLRYICTEQQTCGFCASNKILISIELGPELSGSTGVEVENILARALDRMEQAKPAHAEFVAVLRRTLDAPVLVSATVEVIVT